MAFVSALVGTLLAGLGVRERWIEEGRILVSMKSLRPAMMEVGSMLAREEETKSSLKDGKGEVVVITVMVLSSVHGGVDSDFECKVERRKFHEDKTQ